MATDFSGTWLSEAIEGDVKGFFKIRYADDKVSATLLPIFNYGTGKLDFAFSFGHYTVTRTATFPEPSELTWICDGKFHSKNDDDPGYTAKWEGEKLIVTPGEKTKRENCHSCEYWMEGTQLVIAFKYEFPGESPVEMRRRFKKTYPCLQYVTRKVDDIVAYTASFELFTSVCGAKSAVSFPDGKDPKLMHEVIFCVDAGSYKTTFAAYEKLPGKVTNTKPIKFGGPDSPLAAGHLNMGKSLAEAVITITKRYCKPGQVGDHAKGMDNVCAFWRRTLPSVVGSGFVYGGKHEDGAEYIWDLRLMSDWQSYKDHTKVMAKKELAEGMFGSYDMTKPFTGILLSNDGTKYVSGGSDGYQRFDYGKDGMLGSMSLPPADPTKKMPTSFSTSTALLLTAAGVAATALVCGVYKR